MVKRFDLRVSECWFRKRAVVRRVDYSFSKCYDAHRVRTVIYIMHAPKTKLIPSKLAFGPLAFPSNHSPPPPPPVYSPRRRPRSDSARNDDAYATILSYINNPPYTPSPPERITCIRTRGGPQSYVFSPPPTRSCRPTDRRKSYFVATRAFSRMVMHLFCISIWRWPHGVSGPSRRTGTIYSAPS